MADLNGAGGWEPVPGTPGRAVRKDENGNVVQTYQAPDATPVAPDSNGETNVVNVPLFGRVNSKPLYKYVQGFQSVTSDPDGFIGNLTNHLEKLSGAGLAQLRQQFPNETDDQISARRDTLLGQAQKDYHQSILDKAPPPEPAQQGLSDLITGQPRERSTLEAITSGDWIPGAAGGLVASIADPRSVVPFGKFGGGLGGVVKRIGLGAALGLGGDIAGQEGAIHNQARDKYDASQSLDAGLMGAGVQTFFEATPFIKGLFAKRGSDTLPGSGVDHSIIDPDVDAAQRLDAAKQLSSMAAQPADAVSSQDLRDYASKNIPGGGNVEAIIGHREKYGSFAPGITRVDGAVVHPETINPADVKVAGTDGALTDKLTAEANAFTAKHAAVDSDNPAAAFANQKPMVTPGDGSARVAAAVDHINDVTKSWTNSPDFEIHENFDHLPHIDSTAKGVYTDDGRVLVNMKNIDGPDDLSAMAFHEALGHHGMASKFGDELTGKMEDLYDNGSTKFKSKVDSWNEAHPDYYPEGTPNQKALAVEEVLARDSENGRIKASTYDKLTSTIQKFGRDVGIDSKFSESEVRTILAMSHDATIHGDPANVVGNGFRYEKMSTLNPADDEHSFQRHVMSDGSKVNLLVDKHNNILDVMDHRGPSGAHLPNELKPSATDVLTDKNYKYSKTDPTRRELSQNATKELEDTEKGTTKSVQPFKNEEPDYYRFKHVTEDGRHVDGMYTVGNGKIENMSIHSDQGPRAFGPGTVRQIGRDLLNSHPEATSINGYRMSGARPDAEFATASRFMKREPEDVKPHVGSINPNKINTIHDVDDLLYELKGVNGKSDNVSWDQTEADARERGLTPSRIAGRKGLGETGELTSYIRAANVALAQQLEKVSILSKRLETEGFSDKLHDQALKAFATLKAVHARVNGDNSELGRALNILKLASSSKEASSRFLEAMPDHLLSNPAEFQKFMKLMAGDLKAGNEGAAIRRIADSFKSNAKDFAFRVWYNMLLSGPGTHVANIVSTGANFMTDILEKTGASAIGQAKRFKNEDGSFSLSSDQDRVRLREIGYRIWGTMKGLSDAETYKNTREAFATGQTNRQDNSKTGNAHVYMGDNPVTNLVSGVLESPTRALAAADEYWRNVLQTSNMYGLAIRNAGNKGLHGADFRQEVANLIANPTKEMVDHTNDYTKVIQFLDKPSKIAAFVQNLERSKVGDSGVQTVARGALQTLFPFTTTPDALIRTTLRRTPLGVFERENIKGWQAGGAERDQVVARMTMASYATAAIAAMAYAGTVTGSGPTDPNKRKEWELTHQANSIMINGKYRSIMGLEPLSTNIVAVAGLVEKYKNGEMNKKDFERSALKSVLDVTSAITQNAWSQNMSTLGDMTGKDTNVATTAFNNWVSSTVSSAVIPAAIRSITQAQDPKQRVSTGDGSLGAHIKGSIEAATPKTPLTEDFNSQKLPQKHDVLGRPVAHDVTGPAMLSHLREKPLENDPVAMEIARLGDQTNKNVLGAPKRDKINVNGFETTLNAKQYEMYQFLSGQFIKESLRDTMKTPEWKAMTAEERIQEIHDTAKAMREHARTYLFTPKD